MILMRTKMDHHAISDIKSSSVTLGKLGKIIVKTYAKLDQNIPFGSRVMSIFTTYKRKDGLTDGLIQ